MARCDDCKFYAQYYERGTFCFWNTCYGRCHKHNKTVLRSSKCELFKQKPEPNKKIEMTIDRLNQTVDNIMAIKQILEEKLKKPSD